MKLEKCKNWNTCNKNLCPLDVEIEKRVGKKSDKCRWMREPIKKYIKKRVFISGGTVMPDGLLNLVPRNNIKWLNESSQKRWSEIREDNK